MGLDMYAYTRNPADPSAEPIHLAYWRKHNALHGWMERLWIEKGRPSEGGQTVFNCVPLALTEADIDHLEAAITGRTLKPTAGFFFGASDYDVGEYVETDLNFSTLARAALAQGLRVYYDSWW